MAPEEPERSPQRYIFFFPGGPPPGPGQPFPAGPADGRGRLGLLDRLRDAEELLRDSGGERRPYLELQLGIVVTQWTDSGLGEGIYKATIPATDITAMGILREVVGVETMVEPRPLARVEAPTGLQTGQFYVDLEQEFDPTPTLYVRLPGFANPNVSTIVALLLFTFGIMGEVHPWLGPEKLLNGGFESWTSATDANDWTEVTGSGATVNREAAIVRTGAFSLRLDHAASGSGAEAAVSQTRAFIVNRIYRLAGYYRTDARNPADLRARLRILDGSSNSVRDDGRSYGAAFDDGEPALRQTFGEWRRFLLDFRASTASMSIHVRLRNHGPSGATGTAHFDGLSLRRIYRFSFYEPRLSSASLPELEIAAQDILFGGKTLALGAVTLINADGELAKAISALLVMNKPAQVWIGGRFGGRGQEVYRDDWLPAFAGRTQQPQLTDAAVRWELEDSRSLTKIVVPPNKYTLASFPGMDLNREGYARPIFLGRTRSALIRLTRTGVMASGYGLYESYDNSIQAGTSAGLLRAFPNGELADKNLLGMVIGDSINDFTFSGSTFTILRDIRNYRFDRSGNDVGTGATFDFDVGAGALVASLNIQGPAYQVALDLEAAMRAAIGGGDTTTLVTYSETTHKFRSRRTSGTLNLLPKTGANRHKQSWKILGFDTGSDKMGSNDYTGEQATFTGPDENHVLRLVDAQGYEEDINGAILGGAPGDDLDTPAAAASWLLQRVAKVPPSRMDIPGFKAAHDGHVAENLRTRLWLGSPEELSGVLARIERAGLMDLTVDGEGVWHCFRYVAGTVGALEIFDRDFLSWEMRLDSRSIYRLIRLLYGYEPAQEEWRKVHEELVDAGVPVKHGSDEILEVRSYLDDDAGLITAAAEKQAIRLHRLSSTVPRIASFSIAGRLARKLLGEKLLLTRTGSGVLSKDGKLSAVAFRITALRHNFLSGISRCTAVEDVPFLEEDSVKIDVFTSNGTWFKDPSAKFVYVALLGGGGGGGAGRKGAVGSVRSGGAGGGGGGFTAAHLPASIVPTTVSVVVGAGGGGAAAQTTDSTNGNAGLPGGPSTFGSHLRATAGTGGAGGNQSPGVAAGGAGGIGAENHGGSGGAGNSGSDGSAGQDVSTHLAAGGGGGAGGINSSNVAFNGGVGGLGSPARGSQLAGGSPGSTPGGSGGAGGAATTNESAGGSGGGGGGARANAGANGAGGAGGNYGGGGGGGAAGVDAVVNGGAGGAGAPGIVIVVQG